MKKIVILGSSGSIGENTLDIVRQFKDRVKVVGLSVNKNIGILRKQIREFGPKAVAVADCKEAVKLSGQTKKTKVYSSREGVCELARMKEADIVVVAIVGAEAIFPLMSAIRAGKQVALANKESIVISSGLVRREAIKHNAKIIPIDSEQSAIFQCMVGYRKEMLRRIFLTASGGPLVDFTKRELEEVP
ncbi:MAG TPA: 1-deoxy-D-xylulose-5-phosphate reductoisomerase, partial [Candidatus Omnitrophota bacterium]|nr:1-deoxy-D-xylulose-5-phosphate reductoisomerase [Candidatus Omnitrophota bacterium]